MIETQPPTAQPVPAAEPDATLLVSLSDAAAGKLRELTADETDPAVGLRVYVYSGGCSRYRHRMMLEDQPTEQDVKVDSQGINVHVDPQSTKLQTGSGIDYLDTLMGAASPSTTPTAFQAAAAAAASAMIRPPGNRVPRSSRDRIRGAI